LVGLAAAGVGAIVYGMVMQEDTVFVVGVVCTLAAYAFIRKRLRQVISRRGDGKPQSDE
jgi:hypothetical protein